MDKQLFSRLAGIYGLGRPCERILPLTGGLLHRMFRLDTEKGSFAVKVLNPEVMKRPAAMGDLEYGEQVAQACLEHGIPAVTALRIRGKSVTYVELPEGGAHAMVFPFVPGTVRRDPLDAADTDLLMGALSAIHRLEFPKKEVLPKNDPADFAGFSGRAEESGEPFAGLLKELSPELMRVQALALQALAGRENRVVVSHRDLDRKNVLWDAEGKPFLIDWESAGPVPRAQEMTDVALSWAQREDGTVDEGRFALLCRAYEKAGGPLSDAEKANGFYESFLPRFGWLAYNLERALSSSGEEQKAGRGETELTLRQIRGILSLEGRFSE